MCSARVHECTRVSDTLLADKTETWKLEEVSGAPTPQEQSSLRQILPIGESTRGLVVILRPMSLQHFIHLQRQLRMVLADHRKMVPDHRNDLQSAGE